jgi:CheY-like chemotaxis protein
MDSVGLMTSPSGRADIATLTVLIVDDDAPLVEGLTELLEDEGFKVVAAADGQAALDELRRGLRPCVILLDLMMPGMNGWDFRQLQMSDDELKDLPVVVMTAGAFSEPAVRAQLGDVDLVPKPPSLRRLLEAIRQRCPDLGE